jgi:O-acetylhomoserine (thiol)-lyase
MELAISYLKERGHSKIGCIVHGTPNSGNGARREKAIKFMDSLKFASIVTHVADAKTCLLHPASHTHRQLSDEQLREAGVAPDLIRLSVGIENVEDIIDDLKQALELI